MQTGVNRRTNRRLACVLFSFLALSTITVKAQTLDDFLVTLSDAKAFAEGRVLLVQSCQQTRPSNFSSRLQVAYEETRSGFNVRIEVLAERLRRGTSPNQPMDDEMPHLNVALNSVERFAETAEKILTTQKCPFVRRVSYAKIAALILTPEMAKVVLDFFRDSTKKPDADREALAKKVESRKLLEWSQVRRFSRISTAENTIQQPGEADGRSTSLFLNALAEERALQAPLSHSAGGLSLAYQPAATLDASARVPNSSDRPLSTARGATEGSRSSAGAGYSKSEAAAAVGSSRESKADAAASKQR